MPYQAYAEEIREVLSTASHRAFQVFDRKVRLTEIASYPATGVPTRSQVRIERQGPVNQGCAPIKIADDIAKRISGPKERDCIIAAQLYGPQSQP